MDRTRCGGLSYDQVHELRELRGLRRKDSKAVLKTRLASVNAEERRCARAEEDAIDTASSATGKRGRSPVDAVATSDDAPAEIRGSDAARVLFAPPLLQIRMWRSGIS